MWCSCLFKKKDFVEGNQLTIEKTKFVFGVLVSGFGKIH